MTDAILQALTKTMNDVRAEMHGKLTSPYEAGYVDGITRACEAVKDAIKEAQCAK
jgi:hypothetical protein